MPTYNDNKIASHHLNRQALIYVRQSSMKQVMENTESTARQYALVDTAQTLGWHRDRIDVIDDDLGKSGSSATHRNGFQRLVAEVAMGQVGIVMGLEMSRLARNNADFQHLLHLCGSHSTLIYDADAVYDLMHLNDRLVLGLKGTLSEVELFTIRARLQGGALSKAARGELRIKQLVGDFAAIWSHPATTFQDQKRMIRLLIDDVTLTRDGYQVAVAIRFKTGTILTERFKIPSSGNQLTVIDPQIIDMIDHMSAEQTAGEIASELNRAGVNHPTLQAFTTNAVVYLMKRFNIATRYDRLRTMGYISQEELAASCGVQSQTIRRWCSQEWLQRERYNDQPEYLYKPDFSELPKDITCRYPAIVSANQGGHDHDRKQWA